MMRPTFSHRRKCHGQVEELKKKLKLVQQLVQKPYIEELLNWFLDESAWHLVVEATGAWRVHRDETRHLGP